ncbi:MAG TPA: hypothetical protein ACQGQX_08045 [Xylella taiwanensis]
MQNGHIVCTLAALLGIAVTCQAETLLIDRVKIKPATAPTRNQSMAHVEANYGTPTQKLPPSGGQKRKWPQIDRWVYPNYTVYFEKGKVINVVINSASTDEIGPKAPPMR